MERVVPTRWIDWVDADEQTTPGQIVLVLIIILVLSETIRIDNEND